MYLLKIYSFFNLVTQLGMILLLIRYFQLEILKLCLIKLRLHFELVNTARKTFPSHNKNLRNTRLSPHFRQNFPSNQEEN